MEKYQSAPARCAMPKSSGSRRCREWRICSVVSGTATLIAGSGQINGVAFSGNTMTVNLRNVAEVQEITVTLKNVTSSTFAVLPDTAVSRNVLASDVDGNKTVDRPDVSLIKGDVRMAMTGSNFREDARVDRTTTTTSRPVKATSAIACPRLRGFDSQAVTFGASSAGRADLL